MNTPLKTLLLLIVLSLSAIAQADRINDVKQRMLERQPDVVRLWQAGIIGETNKGYLALAPTAGNQAAQAGPVIRAENTDRQIVYTAIASKLGNVTTEQVGVQRAAQIAERAASGLWLQDANGKWYRKP